MVTERDFTVKVQTCMPWQVRADYRVRVGQKLHTKLMATILSSLNRFSKFAERFSSKFAVVDIKDPTTMTIHCIIMLPHPVAVLGMG